MSFCNGKNPRHGEGNNRCCYLLAVVIQYFYDCDLFLGTWFAWCHLTDCHRFYATCCSTERHVGRHAGQANSWSLKTSVSTHPCFNNFRERKRGNRTTSERLTSRVKALCLRFIFKDGPFRNELRIQLTSTCTLWRGRWWKSKSWWCVLSLHSVMLSSSIRRGLLLAKSACWDVNPDIPDTR